MSVEHRFWIRFFLILSAIAACLMAFASLTKILIPFFTGFIAAYGFHRLVERLEKNRLNRTLASAVIVLGLIFLIFGLTIVALPFFQRHLEALITDVPTFVMGFLERTAPLYKGFLSKNQDQIALLERQLSEHLGDLLKLSLGFFTNLISSTALIGNLLSWILLTPLVMFYFLKDWPRLMAYLEKLIPHAYHHQAIEITREIDQKLSAYAAGQVQVCLILALLYGTGLYIVGLQGGIFVGVVTGFLSFIPYVGALIGFLVSVALSITQTGGLSLIPTIGLVFAVVQILEGQWLTPRLIGQKIGLHPLLILLALLAGGTWFGFAGLVLTLPVCALIGVLVRLGVKVYHNSAFYKKV